MVGTERHSSGNVPKLRPVVFAACQDGLAVRAERHVENPALMPQGWDAEFPALHIPEPHHGVLAPRGQDLAVGAERRGTHAAGMRNGLAKRSEGRQIPQLY
jgi:hypothetical protein